MITVPMHRAARWVAIAGVLGCGACVAVACSRTQAVPTDAGVSKDAGAGKKDASAGKDAGTGKDAAVTDGGTLEPVATTISLSNVGSVPIVIGDQCGGSFLHLSHDGQDLPYDRSCACSCATPGVCGCPPVCRVTEELLVPGQKIAVQWDGLFIRYDDPSCYELAGLHKDDAVTAQACWHQGPPNTPPICATTDFAYDTQRDVVVEVQAISAARTEAKIVLENRTGGPLRIVTDRCGSQQWFNLALPSGDASLATFCPCSCDAKFGRDVCPSCGGCAEDVLETVANGSTHSITWDGLFWHTYPSGCSAKYPMPGGYTVHAEVCFVKANASTPTCEPVSFVLSQNAEVRVVVN
jgi:hypothetical protein